MKDKVQLRVPKTLVDGTRKYGSNWTWLEKDKHTKITSDDTWYYYTVSNGFINDNGLQGVLEYKYKPDSVSIKDIETSILGLGKEQPGTSFKYTLVGTTEYIEKFMKDFNSSIKESISNQLEYEYGKDKE